MSRRYNRYRDDTDDPEDSRFCKLFIGGIKPETSERTVRKYFEQWGHIVDCVVMTRQKTKRHRGFGFITYRTAGMLDSAQENRPHKIDGRQVITKRAIPRNESHENTASVNKMFVGGLKYDTTEDDIREVFSRFGYIEELEMITDKKSGRSRGFCFVTFSDYDSVDKCVLMRRISINGKFVEMVKAFPKNERYRAGFGSANNGCYNPGFGYPGPLCYMGGSGPIGYSSSYTNFGGMGGRYSGYGGGFYDSFGYEYGYGNRPIRPVFAQSPGFYGNSYGYSGMGGNR